MEILILGGTGFLGRHLVEAALKRGHKLTLFNRGETNPHLFPAVEKLHGDRDGQLGALRGRSWDAVVDTCGYLPLVVQESARLLRDSVGHYTFISSVSVYADFSQPGLDEESPTQVLADNTSTDVQEHYGALKALCERVVAEAFPGRSFCVRPGLIVGPHDSSGRFPYWPCRVAEGGEVLAPAHPDRTIQYVDARDLSDWVVQKVESRLTGIYNAVGPQDPLTMAGLLETCKRVTGSNARFTWVSEAFLVAHHVEPWTELPLWLPKEMDGMDAVDNSKAVRMGLAFRPLAETVADTLAWLARERAAGAGKDTVDGGAKAGLCREREAALLQQWHDEQARHSTVSRDSRPGT